MCVSLLTMNPVHDTRTRKVTQREQLAKTGTESHRANATGS